MNHVVTVRTKPGLSDRDLFDRGFITSYFLTPSVYHLNFRSSNFHTSKQHYRMRAGVMQQYQRTAYRRQPGCCQLDHLVPTPCKTKPVRAVFITAVIHHLQQRPAHIRAAGERRLPYRPADPVFNPQPGDRFQGFPDFGWRGVAPGRHFARQRRIPLGQPGQRRRVLHALVQGDDLIEFREHHRLIVLRKWIAISCFVIKSIL